MNTFQNYLYGENKDISEPKNVINISTLSIIPNDVMWFRPYLASDFPEIICDKKYIFIYCTDHSPAAGQIWWGKGNDINCSDFAEQGIILTNAYQCESPYLIRIPEVPGGETICLYYHTSASDPTNSGRQQTHLITTSGGVLHTTTWTQRGTVLGGTEPHTGYLKLYKLGAANYKGVHLTTGGIPQNYAFSTTTDGVNFVRGAAYDKTAFLPLNTQYKINTGYMFNKYGKYWYIGNVAPTTLSGKTTFCLIRLNDDLTPYFFYKSLNKGIGIDIILNKVQGDLEVYVEDDLAYLFWKESGFIKMAKYNLSNLLEYANKLHPTTSGVISYYDFNNNVNDLVGINNGVPTALTYVNDPIKGYAGVFDGIPNTGTKVNLTNAAEFQYNNIGVELFIKSDNTGTGVKCILSKQNAFGIFADSGILKLYSWGGTVGYRNTSVNLNDNVWHKIRVEFRSGVTNGTQVYVDDVLVLTTTCTFTTQTKRVVIGNGNDSSTTPATAQEIKARIKGVKIFNVT